MENWSLRFHMPSGGQFSRSELRRFCMVHDGVVPGSRRCSLRRLCRAGTTRGVTNQPLPSPRIRYGRSPTYTATSDVAGSLPSPIRLCDTRGSFVRARNRRCTRVMSSALGQRRRSNRTSRRSMLSRRRSRNGYQGPNRPETCLSDP